MGCWLMMILHLGKSFQKPQTVMVNLFSAKEEERGADLFAVVSRMEVATSEYDYSTFPGKRTVIPALGNADSRELIWTEEAFLTDLNL